MQLTLQQYLPLRPFAKWRRQESGVAFLDGTFEHPAGHEHSNNADFPRTQPVVRTMGRCWLISRERDGA